MRRRRRRARSGNEGSRRATWMSSSGSSFAASRRCALVRDRALLVIDMLEDFVRPGAPLEVPRTRDILPAVRRRIARARRTGELVVYLCDAHKKNDPEFSRMGWPAHAVAGTKGAA